MQGARHRAPRRVGTVGTRIDGVDVATALTTPEAPDLHGLFAVMREQRRRGLRHGGLQPRAGARPGRRRRLRRRGVPQPRPRPPRLPRDGRGLLPRQGRRCSHPSGPGTRWSTSTTSTAAGWPGRPSSRSQTFSTQGGARGLVGHRRPARPASRSEFIVHGPLGGVVVPAAARCPARSTSPTRWPRWRRAARPASTSRRWRPASRRPAGCPGRFERIDEGQDFTVIVDYAHKPDAVDAALRTLRPLTERRADHRARRRRRPGPGQAPDHGRGRGRALRRPGRHRRQPAQRGPGRDPAGDARRRPVRVRGKRVLEIGDRGAAIARRSGCARPGDIVLIAGQGPRDRPGGRRRRAPVRRPRRGPRRTRRRERCACARHGASLTARCADSVWSGTCDDAPSTPTPAQRLDWRGDESSRAMRAILLGGGIALLISLLGTRVAIRQFTRLGLRPGDPRRRPDQPPHQARHAHHGRRRHHPGQCRAATSRPS